MNTFKIRNRLLTLCLGLALLCLGSRAWQPVHGAMNDPPVPAGLTSAEWQAIQSQIAKLTAADGAEYDQSGFSVSVSGDTAVVGAFCADIGDNPDQGAAYVFYRNQGGSDAWGQVAKLIANDGAENDQFGKSVAIDGDTVVVGAYSYYDIPKGAAYIFYRDQVTSEGWRQVTKLTPADGVAGAGFGNSVSLSGDTAIIGAFAADVSGYSQGATYVFYRNHGGADTWGQVTKFTATDGVVGDLFGWSVAVSGDTAVVGAAMASPGGNYRQGAAYIFYRNRGGSDAWGQIVKIIAADGAARDNFGRSVSISGDTVIVGADYADVGSSINQGAAYIFYRNQSGADAWGQVVKLTAAGGEPDDCFGNSVSVSGDMAVIGAPYVNLDGESSLQGAAYTFYRNQDGANAWGQAAKLIAADGVAGDMFGWSVSMSGDMAIIGAPGENNYQGAACVFGPAPCIPLTDVSIDGPLGITSTLYIGASYHFHVVITPVKATPPITYTWTPTPAIGQGTAEVMYHWMTPGTYTLTLTAANCPTPATVVTATKQVVIEWRELRFIYLPLVQKK